MSCDQKNQTIKLYTGGKMTIRRKNLPELLDISSSALDGILNPTSPYYVADFPKPIKIGARTVLWVIEDIKDYLRQKREVECRGEEGNPK